MEQEELTVGEKSDDDSDEFILEARWQAGRVPALATPQSATNARGPLEWGLL
jgi:hypothetical protein